MARYSGLLLRRPSKNEPPSVDYLPKWAFVRTNDRQIDWKNDWAACRTESSDPSSGTNEITAVSKINAFPRPKGDRQRNDRDFY